MPSTAQTVNSLSKIQYDIFVCKIEKFRVTAVCFSGKKYRNHGFNFPKYGGLSVEIQPCKLKAPATFKIRRECKVL